MQFHKLKAKIGNIFNKFFLFGIIICLIGFIVFDDKFNKTNICIHPATLEGCEYVASTIEKQLEGTEYYLSVCQMKLDNCADSLESVKKFIFLNKGERK